MTPNASHSGRVARGFVVLGLALVLLLALEVFSRVLLEGSISDGPRQLIEVSIPEGATVEQLSKVLQARGLIDHPLLFRYAVRLMGADTKIQAGNIVLASGQSLVELIQNLSRAKSVGVPVLIREGLTSMEIAGIIHARLGIDSTAFLAVIRDTVFAREVGVDGPSLEGYLYPDTYLFAANGDVRRMVRRMVANFRSHLPVDADARAAALGLTLHGALTLASIVEWETMVRSEARTIASVYLNRLRKGMLLQADPTVSYALGKGPSRLFFSDLKVDSRYNTYKYTGLPPGPINNPGRLAIEAALSPESTSYLFFVSQGDGTHAFTTNLTDHLAAKAQLDRIRRDYDREQLAKPDSVVKG
ncbi:endolytic transglycosylase MltG [candidate division KSB1 bacterium]|nr:endolytic transglycosylase MltG [candidate division KSB1 bacterium]